MLPGTATAIIVAVVNFDPLMPQDPFADDPNDPAALFDTEEPMPPLSDEDRRHILEDMELVAQFRAALEPRGVRTAKKTTTTAGTSWKQTCAPPWLVSLAPCTNPAPAPLLRHTCPGITALDTLMG